MQLTMTVAQNKITNQMKRMSDAWGRAVISLLSFCGEVYTLAEWARILGLSYGALFNRLKSSKSIEDAFLQQPQHHNRVKKRREALNA